CLFLAAPHAPTSSTLPLHDALPISVDLLRARVLARARQRREDGQPLAGHREAVLAAEVGEFGQLALHDRSCASDLRTGSESSVRSEEHTSELQSLRHLVCRLLLEKK